MKKCLMSAFVLLTLATACNKKNDAPSTSISTEVKPEAKTELEQLKEKAAATSNGSSITDITFNNGTATLMHTTSYADYKKLNPDSRATPEKYASRWDEENDLYYTLNVTPNVIMRDLPFVKHVITKVKYTDGKIYSTDVDRKDLQAFLGNTVEKDVNNEKSFSGRYVWDVSGRKKFFAKFGKIE